MIRVLPNKDHYIEFSDKDLQSSTSLALRFECWYVLAHVLLKLSVADLRGGGFRGFNPHPPPPLGLPSKNLMCIEKRHHYVQTHTVCSYSTLSQAQPQTIGFKPPPPPLGLPSEHDCDMCIEKRHHVVSIDARKTSLTGVQNSKKNRLAATRLRHRLCIEKRHHAVSRCQENITYRGSK